MVARGGEELDVYIIVALRLGRFKVQYYCDCKPLGDDSILTGSVFEHTAVQSE